MPKYCLYNKTTNLYFKIGDTTHRLRNDTKYICDADLFLSKKTADDMLHCCNDINGFEVLAIETYHATTFSMNEGYVKFIEAGTGKEYSFNKSKLMDISYTSILTKLYVST